MTLPPSSGSPTWNVADPAEMVGVSLVEPAMRKADNTQLSAAHTVAAVPMAAQWGGVFMG
jgi:hypothetical protein